MEKSREIIFLVTKIEFTDFLSNSRTPQCGNYGKSLMRILVKKFVKVTVLLKKLLNN